MNQFNVFIISNTEDSSYPIIRIYLGSQITFETRNQLKDHVEIILNSNVRGIKTIVSANAIP